MSNCVQNIACQRCVACGIVAEYPDENVIQNNIQYSSNQRCKHDEFGLLKIKFVTGKERVTERKIHAHSYRRNNPNSIVVGSRSKDSDNLRPKSDGDEIQSGNNDKRRVSDSLDLLRPSSFNLSVILDTE